MSNYHINEEMFEAMRDVMGMPPGDAMPLLEIIQTSLDLPDIKAAYELLYKSFSERRTLH